MQVSRLRAQMILSKWLIFKIWHNSDIMSHLQAGNPNWKGSRSTVDLLVKIACLYKKKKNYFHFSKQLI